MDIELGSFEIGGFDETMALEAELSALIEEGLKTEEGTRLHAEHLSYTSKMVGKSTLEEMLSTLPVQALAMKAGLLKHMGLMTDEIEQKIKDVEAKLHFQRVP